MIENGTGGERPAVSYTARTSYDDASVARDYERQRFSGALGRYRWAREQRGVDRMVRLLPHDVSVLDCPCGTGRWWPVLAQRARSITAMDVAPAMLAEAEARAARSSVPVETRLGAAEDTGLDDASVDVVFSHALTKHLPIPSQFEALREFSRISRGWVLASFSIFDVVSYPVWRAAAPPESYPLLMVQLEGMAASVGLRIVAHAPCTTPIGVERTILMQKIQ